MGKRSGKHHQSGGMTETLEAYLARGGQITLGEVQPYRQSKTSRFKFKDVEKDSGVLDKRTQRLIRR